MTPASKTGARFRIRVTGDPATQGSTKAFVIKGCSGRMRANIVTDNQRLYPWRDAIATAARWKARQLQLPAPAFPGPLAVIAVVILPRLAKHPKKDTKPVPPPTGKNDTDKHARAIGDALTDAGVIPDDGSIIWWLAGKRYAHLGEEPGADIILMPLEDFVPLIANILDENLVNVI